MCRLFSIRRSLRIFVGGLALTGTITEHENALIADIEAAEIKADLEAAEAKLRDIAKICRNADTTYTGKTLAAIITARINRKETK